MQEERFLSLLGDNTPTRDFKLSKNNGSNVTAINIDSLGINLPPILPKAIKEREYNNCLSLITMVVGDNISMIRDKAFNNCKNLCAIVIPKDLYRIGFAVFSGCHHLQKIIYRGTREQWHNIIKHKLWNYDVDNYKIFCIDGTLTKSES